MGRERVGVADCAVGDGDAGARRVGGVGRGDGQRVVRLGDAHVGAGGDSHDGRLILYVTRVTVVGFRPVGLGATAPGFRLPGIASGSPGVRCLQYLVVVRGGDRRDRLYRNVGDCTCHGGRTVDVDLSYRV